MFLLIGKSSSSHAPGSSIIININFPFVSNSRYNREEVVRSLGKEVNLNPPLILGQLPDTPEELLKLDQVFIKSELKVGVIYVKEVSLSNLLLNFIIRPSHKSSSPHQQEIYLWLFFFFFLFLGSIYRRTNFRQ